MKILVTGANGYLGSGIIKVLVEKGAEVIATDFAVDRIDERASVVAGDIFAIEDPYTYFGQPDVILHLAWRDGFVHYSNAHIEDLPKHYEFIKKMIESGVKKVAVMGSMHEIGFFEGSIDENTACHPITPYGISKNALRDLTKMLADKNGTVFQWLRGYYIVGNTHYGSSIFSKIVAAAEDGQTEFPFTMGQNQYDFIDYQEFCEQVAAATVQNEVVGIINICSGYPEKLADRVERFIKENNFDIKLQYGAFPDRPYDSKAIWGNNKKIDAIMSKQDE
ncbi:MAG: NAD-dependent epimerase/dehydratase family protein [Lacrimispora saccharolytica]